MLSTHLAYHSIQWIENDFFNKKNLQSDYIWNKCSALEIHEQNMNRYRSYWSLFGIFSKSFRRNIITGTQYRFLSYLWLLRHRHSDMAAMWILNIRGCGTNSLLLFFFQCHRLYYFVMCEKGLYHLLVFFGSLFRASLDIVIIILGIFFCCCIGASSRHYYYYYCCWVEWDEYAEASLFLLQLTIMFSSFNLFGFSQKK